MEYTLKSISYKGYPVFEKLWVKTFERIPKVFRENEACFMFVKQGSFSIRMPDRLIDFSTGEGFLSKCFDYFFETNPEQRQKNECLEVIGILLYPEVVKEIFQIDLLAAKQLTNYNLKKVEVNQLLDNFKTSIDILLDNPELVDESLAQTKIKEFIQLVSRTEHGLSLQAFLASLFQKQSPDFRNTILANLYADLSLAELAHLCSMSKSTFKRRFKQTFGESPIKYITNKKLEKAAALLQSKDSRISDIAYDCGFNAISSFNRSFKEKYALSPSEYRLASIA